MNRDSCRRRKNCVSRPVHHPAGNYGDSTAPECAVRFTKSGIDLEESKLQIGLYTGRAGYTTVLPVVFSAATVGTEAGVIARKQNTRFFPVF